MSDDERMEVEEQAGEGEEGTTTKAKGSKSGKRFEIKKWNAVAMWSWAICTDTCAICRNNLYEPSIEYQVQEERRSLWSCAARRADNRARACLAPLRGPEQQG